MPSLAAQTKLDLAVGRLHPELRDRVLVSNLWVMSAGSAAILAVSTVGERDFDPLHPLFLTLTCLIVAAMGLAAWKRAPLIARTSALAGFAVLWCVILFAYLGPTGLAALLLVYFTLLSGFFYGIAGLVASALFVTLLYVSNAYFWAIGTFPLAAMYSPDPRHVKFWFDSWVSLGLGIGLICGVAYYLLRRMSQYFSEEAAMLHQLANEQQLRATAELCRLRSDLARQEAESAFAGMSRAAPIGIALVRERKFVHANACLCRMLGYAEEELLGMATRVLYLSDDDFVRTGADLLEALRRNEVFVREITFAKKSGEPFHAVLTSAPLDWSTPSQGNVATIMDISETRKAAAALRDSELRLREIFDHASDVIFSCVATPEGEFRIERLNRAVARYGVSAETSTGLAASIVQILAPEEARLVSANLRACALARVPQVVEQELTLPTGRVRFATTLVPIIDESSGEVVRIIGISRDVTAQHQLEEFRAAKMAADAASKAKSAFLSSMSHEIRTPLNAVLGFTAMMLRDRALQGRQREFLQIVERNGEHLLSLINDILEISKIEAAKIELRPSEFSPAEVGRQVIETFRAKAEGKSLQLVLTKSAETPSMIFADEGKLRQILLNLMSNAVKFTAAGAVTISLATSADGEYRRLLIRVRDTGPGIAEMDLPRLFGAFEQTEQGRKAGGTGLGLAISRSYARLMGGDITVHSVVGQGTEFCVVLPVGNRHAPPSNPLAVAANPEFAVLPSGRGRKVLIVDDVTDNRLLLKNLLGASDFSVREATNGQEAVELTSAWHPDCILMDMKMPVMDGITAIRLIRQQVQNRKVKIISLSASVFAEERQRFEEAGADAFLPKPVQAEKLLETIMGLICDSGSGEHLAPAVPATVFEPDPVALPRELAVQIVTAADTADYGRIRGLIEQCQQGHPLLCRELARALGAFDYDAIRASASRFLQ